MWNITEVSATGLTVWNITGVTAAGLAVWNITEVTATGLTVSINADKLDQSRDGSRPVWQQH